MTGFDDLWRQAGGGTSRYSQARFNALADADPDLSAPALCDDCPGGRAPHNCWFAAVGAAVTGSRKPRRAARAVRRQPSLFDDQETA